MNEEKWETIRDSCFNCLYHCRIDIEYCFKTPKCSDRDCLNCNSLECDSAIYCFSKKLSNKKAPKEKDPFSCSNFLSILEAREKLAKLQEKKDSLVKTGKELPKKERGELRSLSSLLKRRENALDSMEDECKKHVFEFERAFRQKLACVRFRQIAL